MKSRVRGRWAILSACASLLLVAGAGRESSAQEPRFDGVVLRVATWGGIWRDTLHDLIGKELEKRGAKLEYVLGGPRDNLARLIAARGRDVPFDLIEQLVDDVKPQLLEGQFLEELNFANLPNGQDLDPSQRDRYTVATTVSEHGIVYNAKKFEELGIPKPERLKDLFHPKLAGRVSFPDINVGPAINGIIGFAIEAGGDESNIEPGLELIKQLKVASFWRSSVELETRFNTGDVWVAWWHAGGAVQLKTTGVGASVATSFPNVRDKHGMLAITWAGIPKGGKARRAAEFYINRYLDPEVQATFSQRMGVVPVNKAALARLAADPALRRLMLLDPAQIRNMYYLDRAKINQADLVNKWNRVMAR